MRKDSYGYQHVKEILADETGSLTIGIGKPEQLRTQLVDLRSRRITLEHRMVYAIVEDRMAVVQLRYHH